MTMRWRVLNTQWISKGCVSEISNRALRVREEKSKVPVDAPISRKEYIAMITDRPLCIWGECYPVSQEEQQRINEEKKQKEEIEKMKQKELKAMQKEEKKEEEN